MVKLPVLFHVILSATLFSASFLCPTYCAWGILLFLLPLGYLFRSCASPLRLFFYGVLWGLCAYGLYFIWFLKLLMYKTSAFLLFALLAYGLVVCYSSLTSGFWFWFTRRLVSPLGLIFSLILTACFYFFFVTRYMFWFLGTTYPFLNPIIPLMEYCPNYVICMPVQQEYALTVNNKRYLFTYLQPCKEKENDVRGICELSDHVRSLGIADRAGEYDYVFLVGPETTFAFPLNMHPDYVKTLCWGLPDNVGLLFGSLRYAEEESRRGEKGKLCEKGKLYQTVYWLSSSLIMQFYDKIHRVVFSEKVPRWWKKNGAARTLFLKDRLHISRGRSPGGTIFPLGDGLRVQIVLCSELFFSPFRPLGDLVIAHVNDSWFCPYFRKNLLLFARLNALSVGKFIIYVGH